MLSSRAVLQLCGEPREEEEEFLGTMLSVAAFREGRMGGERLALWFLSGKRKK